MERDTILKQRAIEDRAMELGAERGELKSRLAENTSAITRLLHEGIDHIPLDRFARLVGVGRATLYRWRDRGNT
jgi:hypothetical protein